MARKRISHVLVLALVSILGSSCVVDEDENEVMIQGTVQLAVVGSQCWVIQTAAGKNYEIRNLAPEYQACGLQVKAQVRILDNWASACMMGPIAEVIEIERSE